jgi:hypothetical protein
MSLIGSKNPPVSTEHEQAPYRTKPERACVWCSGSSTRLSYIGLWLLATTSLGFALLAMQADKSDEVEIEAI